MGKQPKKNANLTAYQIYMRNVGDLARIHFDPDENQTCETCFIVWDKPHSKVTEKRTINMLTFEYFKFCFKSLNKIKINSNEEMTKQM